MGTQDMFEVDTLLSYPLLKLADKDFFFLIKLSGSALHSQKNKNPLIVKFF